MPTPQEIAALDAQWGRPADPAAPVSTVTPATIVEPTTTAPAENFGPVIGPALRQLVDLFERDGGRLDRLEFNSSSNATLFVVMRHHADQTERVFNLSF